MRRPGHVNRGEREKMNLERQEVLNQTGPIGHSKDFIFRTVKCHRKILK